MAPALIDLLAGRLNLSRGLGGGQRPSGNGKSSRPRGRQPQPHSAVARRSDRRASGVAGYESIGWSGIVAPKDTPKEIVDRLNGYLAFLSSDPAARKQLQDGYVNPLVATPQELATMIEKEKSRWDNVRSSELDLN